LATIGTLIGLSFDVLPPNFVGFDYNGIAVTANTQELYSAGRYFLGLGHSFIRFPTTQQTQSFDTAGKNPIYGRTSDGLQIILSVTYQYQLEITAPALWSLYMKLLTTYDDDLQIIAQAAILDAASTYSAFNSINLRQQFANDIQTSIGLAMAPYGITVQGLQLESIVLPADFLAAIDATIAAEQQAQQSQFEQITAGINAETAVLTAELQAQITAVSANATSKAIELNADAVSKSITVQRNAEAASYGNLLNQLSTSTNVAGFSRENLLSYVWLSSVQNSNASNLIMNVAKPAEVMFP